MDDALDALGDVTRVDDEKARVEAFGRPGGVIARARKSMSSSAGKTPVAANRAQTPGGVCPARRSRCPDRESRLLEGLADRGERDRRAKPGEGRRTRALSFSSTAGRARPRRSCADPAVRPVRRERHISRHELVACVPLPISTRASRPERSTMISVAASRGRGALAAPSAPVTRYPRRSRA